MALFELKLNNVKQQMKHKQFRYVEVLNLRGKKGRKERERGRRTRETEKEKQKQAKRQMITI